MRFHIENMTCGHCDRTIRKAIAARWPDAQVAIDLRARTVEVDDAIPEAELAATLAEEGYPAVRIGETA
jgi:copper chaperone